MPAVGTVYVSRESGSHIYVVISERKAGKVLVVNFTDENNFPKDQSCCLSTADYSVLSKPSAIAYKRAKDYDALTLDAQLESAEFLVRRHPDCPAEIVAKIVAGARISDFLAPKFLKYLPA